MIELWSAVAVATLSGIVGPVLRGEFSGRLTRRLSQHAKLRGLLVGNASALDHLDSLLTAESEILARRELRRLGRTVDGNSIGALVTVVLVGSGAVYGLLAWALALSGPLKWLLIVVAVVVGLLSFGLSVAGVTSVYKYPEKVVEQPR